MIGTGPNLLCGVILYYYHRPTRGRCGVNYSKVQSTSDIQISLHIRRDLQNSFHIERELGSFEFYSGQLILLQHSTPVLMVSKSILPWQQIILKEKKFSH